MEAKAVKNASSLLHFSGHRELESGLFHFARASGLTSTDENQSVVPSTVRMGLRNLWTDPDLFLSGLF